MDETELKYMQTKMTMAYKAGNIEINEAIPYISDDKEYYDQYMGIWKVLILSVNDLKAKTVLEFGTREGYSTKLFSHALKKTGGMIFTIDKDEPKDRKSLEELGNVSIITQDIDLLDWATPVDILYIDDWHNPWHLYSELERYAKLAREVIIHDVCNEKDNTSLDLMSAITQWSRHNMCMMTMYPMNPCGLAVLHIEKSKEFYKCS